jgi:sugar phosphate isomerase/epimerase
MTPGQETEMNRREFLKTAAGAGVALGLPVAAAAAPSGMYVSLNGTLTGGKVGWPDFVRLAAATGYGGADVNLAGAMTEGLDATRKLFAEVKINPSNCGLPLAATGAEDAFTKSMDTFEASVNFAHAMGCDRMTLVMPASTRTPKDELRATILRRLLTVAPLLERNGIRVGLEFLGPQHLRTSSPHQFIWRMDEMLEFARECGPNFGLLLDAWHWHHAGGIADDIVKAGKSRIVVVHVSDAAKKPPEDVRDNERLMPGEGVIDLVGFFEALKTIGYTDSVSPEPLGRVPKSMTAEEGAKLGLETTRAVMKKAGLA